MKIIAVIVFDQFTDIDFFLMFDVLGRSRDGWKVRVLGTRNEHVSTLGLRIKTDGYLSEASKADVVLVTSGYLGIPAVLEDDEFMTSLRLDPERQLIGSICAGSFVLCKLGLLDGLAMTTHPDAKQDLQAMGADVRDMPLVVQGNIATAGGCLSSMYLTGWVAERLYGPDKRREIHRQLLPAGQAGIYSKLIEEAIRNASRIESKR